MPNDYFPASSGHHPILKQYPLCCCGSKEKQAPDPTYYPANYVPKEDVPLLVDNLIAPSVNAIKEEDQGEEKKGEQNNGEETNREEEEERRVDRGRLCTESR